MTTRKHNEFLDMVPSDEDDATDGGNDSEVDGAESKGRAVKRRRTANDATQEFFGLESDDEDLEDDDGDEKDEKSRTDMKGKGRRKARTQDDANEEDGDDNDRDEDANQDPARPLSKNKTMKPLPSLSTKLLKKPPKKNKTGVLYLSSLPPYLKPFALKSMLEARGFSPITKVFLSPEVPSSSSAPRRRSNKRKNYTDGWVEFASKKTAKICAETLNASIVGGRKGSWYHDDVWNMKYLRGFKWADLMEQVQRERSEREAKQRIEDARARKEEKVFLAGVETGRVVDGMQRKNEEKEKRLRLLADDTAGEERGHEDVPMQEPAKVRRRFQQNRVLGRSGSGSGAAGDGSRTLDEDATRVLGKIF